MNRIAGACRLVWNVTLDDQQILHDTARMFGGRAPLPTFFTLGRAFTQMRRAKGLEWLRELPCHIVRHTLKRQADAWAAFFKGQRGRPKFKGKGCGMGFTLPDGVRIEGGRIRIPKLGWVGLRRRGGNPHPDGVPKQAVFTQEAGKWFCTVFYEVAVEARADDGSSVGVDRNVGQCATSTGTEAAIYHLPDTRRLDAKVRRHQRKMSRRVRGSGRWRKAKAQWNNAQRRRNGFRSNWAHQTSRRIAGAGHLVAIEDLNTKGMTRSAKGGADEPGTGVRAKSGLNRAILSSAWGPLERCLAYKAGRLVRVDPKFTSQTCSACGRVDAKSRINQSTFRCQGCGFPANADENASENIRRRGLAQRDAEGRRAPKARPVKRQTGSGVRRAA